LKQRKLLIFHYAANAKVAQKPIRTHVLHTPKHWDSTKFCQQSVSVSTPAAVKQPDRYGAQKTLPAFTLKLPDV
jgi:hypothetical protein